MKERPIIFTGDRPKGILEGIITQTRRVIKPQPELKRCKPYEGVSYWFWKNREFYNTPHFIRNCPYGVVGDRLWVRETWGVYCEIVNGYEDLYGVCYKADMKYAEPDRRATNYFKLPKDLSGIYWRSSIHIPKWAARIWLEITGIRVERLQDISETDCWKEGLPKNRIWSNTKKQWIQLWDSLNAKRGYPWEKNRWVWVIEFKRIEQ
jgi:hypothetical protein